MGYSPRSRRNTSDTFYAELAVLLGIGMIVGGFIELIQLVVNSL